MAATENIWVVEHDPEIAAVLQSALQAMGYTVQVVPDSGSALSKTAQGTPSLAIVDLHLPGLSGKDLLAAWRAQNIQAPVIAVARQGEQEDIIQAFRLGAADYLAWPVREAEVVSAAERVLGQQSARRERDALLQEVQRANQGLRQQVRDLQAITALGKAVVSTVDQRDLLEKIVEGAVFVSRANIGWFLLYNARQKNLILAAQHGLPKTLLRNLHRPWDDGISRQVFKRGKPRHLAGKQLASVGALAGLGKSVIAMPVRIKKDVAGVLVAVRKSRQPFSTHEQAMLSAVADYASIALVNLRMMHVLQERAQRLEHMAESVRINEQIKAEILKNVSMILREPLTSALGYTEMLAEEQLGTLNVEQTQAVMVVRQKLQVTSKVAEHLTILSEQEKLVNEREATLQSVVQQVLSRLQGVAQQREIGFVIGYHQRTDILHFNPAHLERVVEAMLVHALHFAPRGAQITISTLADEDKHTMLRIRSKATELTTRQVQRLVNVDTQGLLRNQTRFTGVSIGLSLAEQVAALYGAALSITDNDNKEIAFELKFAE